MGYIVMQLESERDIIGTQVIRRNDELILVNEKVHIQHMTLITGNRQYNERLEDIRVLKLEIRQLRHKNLQLQQECNVIGDMRYVRV